MKTVNIKGKEYVMVNERIKEFRKEHPNYSLESEVVVLDSESCVIKAIVKDENGRIIATGLAQEDKSSSTINKTSYVENCETSAWGRALGNLGIGIDVSIASAEEMDMAVKKQEKAEQSNNTIVGGLYMFSSGKHAGKTIKEVDEEDSEYLDSLLSSEKVSKIIKDNIMEYRK